MLVADEFGIRSATAGRGMWQGFVGEAVMVAADKVGSDWRGIVEPRPSTFGGLSTVLFILPLGSELIGRRYLCRGVAQSCVRSRVSCSWLLT